ncbi:HlyD family efflux transporter periplasmic adaptor subunit [Moorena sp. SIO3H5]|uniref:HlyD family efflux transporter periplasmic adaptor subunit n=1 Tax=Moorena sp. SIO3H5 TaxID=2607834 RepID=UPI0013B9B500|nr:HlyD family efflux transporter periplasmic adaptor subunit [Moorena sp. SIO3H5]NEO72442.1 HlyD family efflux transporter periplasmic adaptor subunit [Moorena sp. SIO3H5]
MSQYNGNGNGNGNRNGNGNGNGKANPKINLGSVGTMSKTAVPQDTRDKHRASNSHLAFDQPVILEQSPHWSHAILWALLSLTSFGMVWAYFAKIDYAVPARGKLEPQGAVKEVQAPVGGVVTKIHIKEGQRVKEGDLLLSFEPKATQAQLTSLNKRRATLIRENQFYQAAISNPNYPPVPPPGMDIQLSSQLPSLIASRNTLLSEIGLYRAQLSGGSARANLSPEQRIRLQYGTSALEARIAELESRIGSLQEQLKQNQIQLANGRDILSVEQGILADLRPLFEQGGFSKIQFLRQENEVKNRQTEINSRIEEEQRLQKEIAGVRANLLNTIASSQRELTDLMAQNNERIDSLNTQIASIISQLNQRIVENNKQMAEIDSQLQQAQLTLSYQELRAPVDGTIFDLQPSTPGFVANTTEPVLKIVPASSLIAKVFLTNRDIGFVEPGMETEVRVDSFPFSEFGDVKGKVLSIGSDALPPDPAELRQDYTFPAKIELDKQFMTAYGKDVPLQSGMSISANIRVRKRTVMSIFTEMFLDKTESLTKMR